MKMIKVSLAATLLMAGSAYAIEADKMTFSADAKLFYATIDNKGNEYFGKEGAYGNAAAGVDGEYKSGISTVNLGVTFLSTMGLENTLVGATWAGNTVDDQIWIDEAKFTYEPIEKTVLMLGRQYVDTPLAFSETWNIVANSMDAGIIADSHIPETTLIGAWIGRGNGMDSFQVVDNNTNDLNLGGNYEKYGSAIIASSGLAGLEAKGAYAVGGVTNLIPMTTAQAWYYDVVGLATAYWLQADVDAMGIMLGGQFSSIDPDKNVDDAAGTKIDETTGWSVKLGYAPEGTGLSVWGAYSDIDEGNSPIQIANTATGGMNGAATQLYTEAWWNFGYVGAPGSSTYHLVGEYSAGFADFGLYYTNMDNKKGDMQEATGSIAKSFGKLDTSLVYIWTDADADNGGDAYGTIQVYLTYNM